MKKLKNIIAIFMVVLMVSTVVTPIVVQASTKLNKTKITLNVNKTYKLKVTGTKKNVKWYSSNKKIATVNSKGKVKAIKPGKTTIYAKIGKNKLSCKVTVKKKQKKDPKNVEIKALSNSYVIYLDDEKSYYDTDNETYYIELIGMISRNTKTFYVKVEGFDKNGNKTYYDVLPAMYKSSVESSFYVENVPDDTVSLWVSDYYS